MKELKPIFVKWLDHSTYQINTWRDYDTIKETLDPSEVKSMGWLLKETKDYLLIVSHITSNENGTGEFCILKKTIIERRYL